jgi:hypothetical protein
VKNLKGALACFSSASAMLKLIYVKPAKAGLVVEGGALPSRKTTGLITLRAGRLKTAGTNYFDYPSIRRR